MALFKKLSFSFLIIAIPVFAFFAIIELSLRVANFGYNPNFAIKKTINGEEHWVGNPDFTRLFFPPELNPYKIADLDHWQGMQHFLEFRLPESDPRLPSVYQHFERNLREIRKSANQLSIPTLFATVAVNLANHPPFADPDETYLTALSQRPNDPTIQLNRIQFHIANQQGEIIRDELQNLTLKNPFDLNVLISALDLSLQLKAFEWSSWIIEQVTLIYPEHPNLDNMKKSLQELKQ